jgi:hypothetical protein
MTNKISIAPNIAITPPNLSGIDLNMVVYFCTKFRTSFVDL